MFKAENVSFIIVFGDYAVFLHEQVFMFES